MIGSSTMDESINWIQCLHCSDGFVDNFEHQTIGTYPQVGILQLYTSKRLQQSKVNIEPVKLTNRSSSLTGFYMMGVGNIIFKRS